MSLIDLLHNKALIHAKIAYATLFAAKTVTIKAALTFTNRVRTSCMHLLYALYMEYYGEPIESMEQLISRIEKDLSSVPNVILEVFSDIIDLLDISLNLEQDIYNSSDLKETVLTLNKVFNFYGLQEFKGDYNNEPFTLLGTYKEGTFDFSCFISTIK